MAKKRRQRDGDANAGQDSGWVDDPLGRLIQQHQVSLAGVLIVSGIMGSIGIAALCFALTREPYSLVFLLVGTGALLLAMTVLVMNIFNVGRRLELRKKGVRFSELGIVREFFWDDIAQVEVNRTDDTYVGIGTMRTRSGNASRPSGPLTKTEWHVVLHAHDGRTIHLRPMFMRTVRDPKKLVSQLRMRAGLP